ncbi:MAG: flagellar motor switch protein FliG [Burkholderiaceae bacterium]|nr:flagellar motor switch protein FliG [Burkholderiaceae bacterium]
MSDDETPKRQLDGSEKSAVLMLALGADEAAEVMKHFGPREVQRLGAAMSSMKGVSAEVLEDVLVSFMAEISKNTDIGVDPDSYLRDVLTKALGDDKASGLISRILGERDTGGIESLKWMDGQTISDLIRNEHPQIIAAILVHLEPDHASEVLSYFSERVRNDVVLRIATLEGIQPSALRELNDVLTKLLMGNENVKKKQVGGIRAVADILNYLGGEMESSVMEHLKEYDANMAQEIMDEMFVFENIVEIDNRGIQIILREVQSDSLIVALKGASEELRDKIFRNMSQRASEMLREDLEAKGPVRLSEVEATQKEILVIVRRLAEEGQIVIGSKGEDQYV